ncbi:MAG: hypothetical protein HC919_09000 [Oscillatoriales cyanobacterium SM2_2_1]|nr:hypothetical protein [Oscillatoriales cyanobacterium SM2_2_1]
MRILSHRGYWQDPSEKNQAVAFRRSFALGFGTETDIRDRLGELVIAHDPPVGGELTVSEFLTLYSEYPTQDLPLALNIKADGLQTRLQKLLDEFQITNYFCFDMAIPDAKLFADLGLRFFTRHSELEPEPSLYDRAAGVWVDGFYGEWFTEAVLGGHLNDGKQVCLVSPDLHKRPHEPFWQNLRTWAIAADVNLMLCTDFPEAAQAYVS